ncbi:MAG: hypothetical protein KAI24_10055, partial [Planctomycetes bacterium]|nr:hypothetical protein [Planctomycetota bacterium]
IAASPSASPADQRLGARILLAKQTGFGGDAAEQRAMLQQVVAFSERAYADGGDVKDVFRAWQAAKRMWDHPRAEQFAQQLAQQHGDSMQHRLVALSASFDPARDAVALADLVIDFGDDAPAELAALQTAAVLQSGKVPEALAKAEKDLLRYAGVGGVRYVLAIVLHACVLGSAEGSLDRATFAKKRDLQLDWLAARAPADEPLRQRWQAMRAIR